MVRVHSGLPFQVATPFSTCAFVPVFRFYCTSRDSGDNLDVRLLTSLLRERDWLRFEVVRAGRGVFVAWDGSLALRVAIFAAIAFLIKAIGRGS